MSCLPRGVFALLGLIVAFRLWAAPPEVLKVEPPNWWSGDTTGTLRLLITGRNLAGAEVIAPGAGLRCGSPTVSARATHLFVDLELAAGATPGPRRLLLRTPGGEATAAFEILPALARSAVGQGFSSEDVLYLIMPDRFSNGDPANDDPSQSPGLLDRAKPRHYHGGDLRGIIRRLDYLKDLGVTALWLNPWYDNHNRLNERERYTRDNRLDQQGEPITDYHGYGAVDFYAVEEHFGDLATLRELVAAAHARGLKIIQDQVVNHTGPYHPWVADPPTPTWFHGSPEKHLANTWQTWRIPDPHATPAWQQATLEGWFVDILPDLNQDDPECARYLVQNAAWWVGVTGVDAVRQDTLPYVPRTFWRTWSGALHAEFPRLVLLGEMFDGDAGKVSFFQGGRARFDGVDSGIDALFDFPLFYPVRRVFAEGRSIQELPEQLARDHLYERPDRLVTFLGLHDVDRFMNVPGATDAGLRLAFTFLMTTRGVPLIYYGDELGMAGGGDPDNRRDFPGGWAGDPRNAFEAAGRTPAEQGVFAHVQQLTRLRAKFAPLRRGQLKHLDVGDQTYAYARVLEGEPAVVMVFNNATTEQSVEVPLEGLSIAEGRTLQDHLRAVPEVRVEHGRATCRLPGRSAAMLSPRP